MVFRAKIPFILRRGFRDKKEMEKRFKIKERGSSKEGEG